MVARGVGLIASQWSWDADWSVWVKWARPLVFMTLWSRVMFNWKAVSNSFHGPSYTIESQWGNFGTLLHPRGATFTPFWGMVLQSLPASSSVVIHKFLRNSRSELRPAKVCPMHCQWDFLGDYLPLGRTSYPRSLIKVIAHHSRLGRTFWHLIHGSVTKTAGGVARRKKSGRRRIIITRMYISRRKCEWCLQWQNSALDRY